MDFGKDYKIYDPNYADHPNHNHIICDDCDKVVEFESDQLDTLENEISQNLGFHVKTQQLRINASCDEMKKLGVCDKKEQ
jgi:Fur family ferric uptake transcriptional regulator